MAYTPWELAMGQNAVNTGGAANRVVSNTAAATARGGYNSVKNYQYRPNAAADRKATILPGRPGESAAFPKGPAPLTPGGRQPTALPGRGGTTPLENPRWGAPAYTGQSGWFTYLPGAWGYINAQGKANYDVGAPPTKKNRVLDWYDVSNYLSQAGRASEIPGVPEKPTTNPEPGYTWRLVGNKWVQKLILGIDPRDAKFFDTVRQLDFTRSTAASALNSQLAQMQSKFTAEELDRLERMEKSRYQSNADLISRGIYDSGERGNEALRLRMEDAKSQLGLSEQYGQLRQSGINRSLADLQSAYAMDVAQAIQAAKDKYKTSYPASSYLSQYLSSMSPQ